MNWRRPAFLLAHDLIGSRLRANYQEFLAAETWQPPRLNELHQKRLASILRHASQNIPFYRERVSGADLSLFPILRKHDVQAHFTQLMEPALLAEYRGEKRKDRYSWVEVKTGGTTGAPTKVIHDQAFRDWGRAGRLFSQHLCGFPLGTPFFMLWGSMRDINESKDSAQKRVLNALLQARPLNAFLMDDARMRDYARQINESTIRHLMAYVDAAYELARFVEKDGAKMRPLESIMACAGTVTDEHRATLARVFGGRVHNKYGSRECADIACECRQGGFHIFSTGVHVEILDDANQPVPPGVTGRIVLTLLHNHRFPMIRYEIGDIGALSARSCSCGSPMPLLDRVEGRLSDVVLATNGTYVSPLYIVHLIGVAHNPGTLGRFQFVQAGAASYSLTMQMDASVNAGAFAELTAAIRRDLEKVLGPGADLSISRVDRIAPSESGKYLYVRNLHRSR